IYQPNEAGLNDWIIKAASNDHTFFGTTDATGHYDITIAAGTYTVSVLKKNQYWDACIAAYNVNFSVEYDTLVRNFPMLPTVDCPLLQVDIAAPVAQNCSNIAYNVSYCNIGTIASPTTTVNVVLDNGLSYTGATIPLASQNDSLLVFEVGSLGLNECGSFTLLATSDCNGQPEEAYIVSAHILPDAICLPVSPDWDMSNVTVNGYCAGDSVKFLIKNNGIGDMDEPKGFIVIEDHIMLMSTPEPFQLTAGQSLERTLPGNGSTYRLIAEQSEGHPGNSYPTVAVEGCTTTPGDYNTGFVTELQEDENDPFTAVDAQESIENFTDYIFVRGYPKGYLRNSENLIPANTDIEYHVYFQNVSMDTITRLVVRDTLSPFLDISTVAAGSSSHPYDFEVYSNGVVKFTFDNLQLLPGGGAASEGFVRFRVSQIANNPTGTQIDNSATVFMGFDEPVQTATYTHVIGGDSLLDFIVITDVNTPQLPDGVAVSAWPNPFASAIEFEAKNLQCKSLTINVYDINGRPVRQEKTLGNKLRLQRNGLPSGSYAYQLAADGRLVHTGKIIVR
ncbi:MAG: T9SS type A sorting domain-containing protein, partial [Saprospiraceae bacterium]|nr:T9SS type A sorting domain-containing protein [Saprospiraceae bacterium]